MNFVNVVNFVSIIYINVANMTIRDIRLLFAISIKKFCDNKLLCGKILDKPLIFFKRNLSTFNNVFLNDILFENRKANLQ